MGLSDMGMIDQYLALASDEPDEETPSNLINRLTDLYDQLVEALAENTGAAIYANHHCADAPWLADYHRFGAEFGAAVGRLGRVIEEARRK